MDNRTELIKPTLVVKPYVHIKIPVWIGTSNLESLPESKASLAGNAPLTTVSVQAAKLHNIPPVAQDTVAEVILVKVGPVFRKDYLLRYQVGLQISLYVIWEFVAE